MTFQDLYPGQRVRILSWDELNSISQYHFNGLLLPDRSIFNNKMKYLCGVAATVTDHIQPLSRNLRYLNPSSLILDDGVSLFTNRDDGRWSLSPAMLVPLNESPSVIPPAISFDQLITGGELPQ